MKNKFKVGDRVHFTTAGEKVFKIVSIDSTQIPYELESIDNLDETFFTIESNIKLIPTMKNLKDLGEKVAIQCKTQEEWDFVTKELGYKWTHAKWADYKENSIILSHDSVFGTVLNNTYKVVQASEFMPLSPQDEIKELKERIATLEETLRPKKKIEFVKFIDATNICLENTTNRPSNFKNIVLLHKGLGNELDLIKAWDINEFNAMIYLGHFNDGEK